MCGRYVGLTADEIADIVNVVQEIDAKINGPKAVAAQSDGIFPGAFAPVLLPGNGGLSLQVMLWGYPGYPDRNKPHVKPRPLINAKSETVTTVQTWRDSVVARRCIIPSGGFFEWQKNGREKTKYLFRLPGEDVLYMAAIYKPFALSDGNRIDHFSILTTAANKSMIDVHDRMPVVLRQTELTEWLHGDWTRLFERESVLFEKKLPDYKRKR